MSAVDQIGLSDIRRRNAMERGSRSLLKAIRAAREGKPHLYGQSFIWGACRTDYLPKMQPGSQNSERLRRREEEPEPEPLNVVNRDPCPRCGSKRGSCNHKTTGRLVTA